MKTYQVGGSVRDQIMGKQPKDIDWVVVGASEKIMISKGFKKIGASFPVFIHPESKEEYALARTEKKTASGHKGFSTNSSAKISLEEDLSRRDFTINALALDDKKNLIDLFNGKEDIEKKILRHITDAFSEDPLRVVRAARFSATLGFGIAEETKSLMKKMVNSGELSEVSPERIERELQLALSGEYLYLFFDVLDECGAIKSLFPELNDSFLKYTKQELTFILNHSSAITSPQDRTILLLFYISLTSKKFDNVINFCERLRIPKKYQEMAISYIKNQPALHDILTTTSEKIIQILEDLDSFRRPERLSNMILIEELRSQASSTYTISTKSERNFLNKCFNVARVINAKSIFTNEDLDKLSGALIKKEIKINRIRAIQEFRNSAQI